MFVTAIVFLALSVVAFFIYHVLRRTQLSMMQKEAKENNEPRYKPSTSENSKATVSDVRIVKNGFKVGSAVLLFLAILFSIFASVHTVPVRNIGIVSSFGKPTGETTGSGLSIVWPWQTIKDFDASVQTSNHLGNWDKGCTVVRIGSLAQACVENRVRWQVVETAAPRLYEDYKGDFDNMKSNLVEMQIQNALNAVFANYNPLAQIDIKTGETSFDGTKLSNDIKGTLTEALGTDIRILDVSVPLVHHDAKTEENIKAFQDAVAKARILDQLAANADKEKAVSTKLQPILNHDYLVNKCIENSVVMGFAPGLCLMSSGIVSAPTNK